MVLTEIAAAFAHQVFPAQRHAAAWVVATRDRSGRTPVALRRRDIYLARGLRCVREPLAAPRPTAIVREETHACPTSSFPYTMLPLMSYDCSNPSWMNRTS